MGLPKAWLQALPEIDALPGDYARVRYGADAFLTWKRQEMLVRTGHLDQIDRALVAEALEGAAAADGLSLFRDALVRLLFLLAWPHRTYHLHVALDDALDRLRGCLEASPSMRLFEDLEGAWRRARFEVIQLDDAIPEPPEACPWSSRGHAMRVAGRRLRADRRRFP